MATAAPRMQVAQSSVSRMHPAHVFRPYAGHLAAGLLVGSQAGSGVDRWGENTLTNYPPGEHSADLDLLVADTDLAPTPS